MHLAARRCLGKVHRQRRGAVVAPSVRRPRLLTGWRVYASAVDIVPARVRQRVSLDDRPPGFPAHDQKDRRADERDHEDDEGDVRERSRDAAKAENRRDQR